MNNSLLAQLLNSESQKSNSYLQILNNIYLKRIDQAFEEKKYDDRVTLSKKLEDQTRVSNYMTFLNDAAKSHPNLFKDGIDESTLSEYEKQLHKDIKNARKFITEHADESIKPGFNMFIKDVITRNNNSTGTNVSNNNNVQEASTEIPVNNNYDNSPVNEDNLSLDNTTTVNTNEPVPVLTLAEILKMRATPISDILNRSSRTQNVSNTNTGISTNNSIGNSTGYNPYDILENKRINFKNTLRGFNYGK